MKDVPLSETNLSARSISQLRKKGINTLSSLINYHRLFGTFKKINNIGTKCNDELIKLCEWYHSNTESLIVLYDRSSEDEHHSEGNVLSIYNLISTPLKDHNSYRNLSKRARNALINGRIETFRDLLIVQNNPGFKRLDSVGIKTDNELTLYTSQLINEIESKSTNNLETQKCVTEIGNLKKIVQFASGDKSDSILDYISRSSNFRFEDLDYQEYRKYTHKQLVDIYSILESQLKKCDARSYWLIQASSKCNIPVYDIITDDVLIDENIFKVIYRILTNPRYGPLGFRESLIFKKMSIYSVHPRFTLSDVANDLTITKERVRQLLLKIESKVEIFLAVFKLDLIDPLEDYLVVDFDSDARYDWGSFSFEAVTQLFRESSSVLPLNKQLGGKNRNLLFQVTSRGEVTKKVLIDILDEVEEFYFSNRESHPLNMIICNHTQNCSPGFLSLIVDTIHKSQKLFVDDSYMICRVNSLG